MLDNEFDKKLRSMLEDAAEEVPGGVWEGVSASLDRAAGSKRRVPPVFWWWMTSGVAVAASLALVLILWPAKPSVMNASVLESQSYEIEKVEAVPDIEPVYRPSSLVRRTARKAPASMPETAIDAMQEPASTTPVTVSETPEPVSVAPDPVSETPEPVVVTPEPETVDTPAPAEPVAPQAPVRVSRPLMLTASGNAFAAMTARGSGQNGMKKAPALLRAPSETGVTRTGGTAVYGLPVTAGVGVRYYVSRRVSLGTGLEYTYLTRTFSGTYNEVAAMEDGGSKVIRSVTSDVIRNEQHYLGVPVNVYVDVLQGKRFRAYAHAGGAVEKSVKNHYKIPSGSGIISCSEKVKGVQCSVGGGIGVEVRLGKHVGLYVDPGVKYYFDGKQPGSIRTAQPLMMNVDMGVRFNIN